MRDCTSCEQPVDAVTAAYVLTEFLSLGEVSMQHVFCSPACLIDFADSVELALEGGATQ